MSNRSFHLGASAEGRCRVKGRNDDDAVSVIGPTPQRGDAFGRSEQGSRGRIADRQDCSRLEVGKLPFHIWPTGCQFNFGGRSILRWPASNDIGNGEGFLFKAKFLKEDGTEEPSGTTNKGDTGSVFFSSRCLAEHKEARPAISNPNDRMVTSFMK